MSRQLLALLVLAVVPAWACNKSPSTGPPPAEGPPPPSTVAVAELAGAPTQARVPLWQKRALPAHGPPAVALPEDTTLAAWTTSVEAAFYPALELRAMAPLAREAAADPRFVERALSAWEQINGAGLPRDAHIRQRAAADLTEVLTQLERLRAAAFAEHNRHPELAAPLYDSAGQTAEAARARAAAQAADQVNAEFSARHQSPHGQPPKELPSTPQAWLAFLSSGPMDPWARDCERGVAAFLEHVPDNARLRRALLLSYTPCRFCGLSPIEGELDVIEPMLRLTAEAFPSDVAQTFAFWLDSPARDDSGVSPRIPGDYGTTGNVLAVMRDVLGKAPQAKEPLLAVAIGESAVASNPGERARWIGLASYLTDGAPEPTEALLIAKLGASISEQRWALAWLPNKLVEQSPPSVRKPSDALRSAIVAAWSRSPSQIDRLLVLDALHSMPPATGIEVLVAAAGSADEPLEQLAMAALVRQFNAARDSGSRDSGSLKPFAAVLPGLRGGFYPLLCSRTKPSRLGSMLSVFSDLGDAEIDRVVAGCLARMTKPDTSLMQAAAANAMLHPKLDWRQTATAFRELAARPGFAQADYALRLANDLDVRH